MGESPGLPDCKVKDVRNRQRRPLRSGKALKAYAKSRVQESRGKAEWKRRVS